jgi:acyl transferase domain-containing protein
MGDMTHPGMTAGYAIVGIGCRFPGGADSPAAFWELLREGRDVVGPVPEDRPDWAALYDPDPAAVGRIYAREGGFVDGIDAFDPLCFGISPREAVRMDPQQRLLLEVVWHAVEDARIDVSSLAGSDTGVFVGISTHDYADVQMHPENRMHIDAHSNTGGATSIAANRISYAFDLRGPSLAVDTACSSAMTAVHLAGRALESGECDLAVAAGVQLLLRPELTIGFCRATMLSVDGRCKAFDASGNGYVRSEGAGAVVLKRLADALADGDPIHAVVLGTAINQDGRSAGMTVPNEASQQAMLRTALRRAGVAATDVQYVEAHGTGTPVGDPIEARAIGGVFAPGRPDDAPLRIGSVKTNIGHLEAASGIAGLIKTALALRHRELPASLHFSEWNPDIDPDALKLAVVTEHAPWPAAEVPPTAAVSSFGFGGANASAVLRAAPAAATAADGPGASDGAAAEADEGTHLLPLSARSPEALRALALAHVERLLDPAATAPLSGVCGAAALGRAHHDHRLAVTGTTREDLASGLESFVAGERAAGIASGRASGGAATELALVFSGMGPQWWGMGRQLLDAEPVVIDVIDRCDAALRPVSGWSLVDAFRADEATSRLAHPQVAQVSNFALQVALAALWRSWGIQPRAVVGHSGGAMAAAYEAGVHTLEESIRLAYHRSELQGRDSGAGAMLAVGLPADRAEEVIGDRSALVSLAAVNAPAGMTLAGDEAALREIADELTARQVFARMLPVTIAYHSPTMDPIREPFLAAVAGLEGRATTLPLVSDTTGTWADGTTFDPGYWWRAIRQPVRFADSIATLVADGITGFVEVSPHPVLAASIGECLAALDRRGVVVPTLRRGEDDRTTLRRSLATLYAEGASPRWQSLYRRDVTVDLPLYPFQRERHWFEPDGDATGAEVLPTGEADANPLLGRRLPSAHPTWEARLAVPALAYLDDHVVQGTPVFPGAGYVATALAAARRLQHDSRAHGQPHGQPDGQPDGEVVLRDITFVRPLVLPTRDGVRLQTVVDPDTGAYAIHAGPGADPAGWDRCSRGRIATGALAPPDGIDVAALAQALGPPTDGAASLRAMRRRGLQYGPAFEGIVELRHGAGEDGRAALARIGPVEGLTPDPDSVHPALLDAAFQLLAVVADAAGPDDDRLFLPTAIDRVRLRRPAGASFTARCRLDAMTRSRVVGSVELLDEDGTVVLSVEGLTATMVEGAADREQVGVYDHRWEAAAAGRSGWAPRRRSLLALDAPSGDAAVGAAPDTRLDTRLDAAVAAAEAATGWSSYYTDAEPILSDVAAGHVLAALAVLDLPAVPGDVLTAAQVAGLRALDPSGGRWTDRLLGLLVETGCATATGDGWRIDRIPDPDAADRLPGTGFDIDVALLAEAGRTLPAALTGRAGADGVVSADTLPLLTAFYRDAPASAFANRVLGEVVAALADRARPRCRPSGRGTC